MEISIKHLKMSLSFPFGLLYLPKLFSLQAFQKFKTIVHTFFTKSLIQKY